MSVAFRRESDDEHKEPKFELPIPPGPNLVTARGLALIEDQLKALEAEVAAGGDDETLAPVKRCLRYWRTRHATAELVPPPSGNSVQFGSTVRFRLKGKERSIEIVGDDEADPAAGRVAFSAPLARAMIGLEVGEFGEFAGEEDAIEVLAVGVG